MVGTFPIFESRDSQFSDPRLDLSRSYDDNIRYEFIKRLVCKNCSTLNRLYVDIRYLYSENGVEANELLTQQNTIAFTNKLVYRSNSGLQWRIENYTVGIQFLVE